MGHIIRGFVIPEGIVSAACRKIPSAKALPLAQGLRFVPLTDEVFDELEFLFENEPQPEGHGAFERLSGAVWQLGRTLSDKSAVGYVETDYFGGVGSQAAIAWRDGRLVVPPSKDEVGPINRVL